MYPDLDTYMYWSLFFNTKIRNILHLESFESLVEHTHFTKLVIFYSYIVYEKNLTASNSWLCFDQKSWFHWYNAWVFRLNSSSNFKCRCSGMTSNLTGRNLELELANPTQYRRVAMMLTPNLTRNRSAIRHWHMIVQIKTYFEPSKNEEFIKDLT